MKINSQNGEGQYHKNCYTMKKLEHICDKMGFFIHGKTKYKWPRGGDDIIRILATKVL